MLTKLRPLAALPLLLLLSACHGGGGGGVAPAPDPAGFTFVLAPASLGAYPGGTASATATVIRTGGFTGAVALGLQDPPAGLTAVGLVAEGATSGRLQLAIPPSLPAQTLRLTVTASGGGQVRTAALTLVLASGLELLPADRVHAAGSLQRSASGGISNQAVALEQVRATTATAGQVEHRSGFQSTGQ